jgi:tetrahydromethanopterin S-methyltransferase subunit G
LSIYHAEELVVSQGSRPMPESVHKHLTPLKKLLGFVGTTIGSAAGWWLGRHIGIMTAFLLSVMGTGIGLYVGLRIGRAYTP